MNVNIRRLNDDILFEAANELGVRIHMDGSADIGGRGAGFRPMELLLAGIGGCSAIDVVEGFRKAAEPLKDLDIRVSGARSTTHQPAVFSEIHLHYTLAGALDPDIIETVLEAAILQDCSVGDMLSKTATITYSYDIKTP
jgi:putative redox protein